MTGGYVTTKGRTFPHPGYTRSGLRYPNDRGAHGPQHLLNGGHDGIGRSGRCSHVATGPEVVSLLDGMPGLAAPR